MVSGLGIFFLTLLVTFFAAGEVLRHAPIYVPEAPVTVWYILFLFLLVTAAIVFLLRFVPGRALFTLFFALAMFTGVWFLADIFLPGEIALLAGAGLVLVRYLVPRVAVQNILIICGVAGIAVSLGLSLPWQTVLALAAMLSIYDIVAVYGTHHMVTMMKGLLARGVIFAAVVPEKPHALGERVDSIHPGEGVMLVGTGDLALPAMFVASALVDSPIAAIGAAIGALLGFAATSSLFLGMGRGKPMPALPPIVAGMTIGFLVSLLWH